MDAESRADYRQLEVAPILTRISTLQSNRHYRDQHNLFFIEGVRNFVGAMDQGFVIDTLLYSEKLLTSPIVRKFVRRLKRAGVPFARVSPEQFRTISRAEHASGIGVILHQRIHRLERVKPGDFICWTVLSHVRSPGNFGTLMRTSAAIGAAGFILLGDQIDPYDPRVIRATMGSIFKQAIVRTTVNQFREWIQRHGLQVVGASPDGPVDYDQVRYARPTMLLLGEERLGLPEELRSLCQSIVRIPMAAGMDSLNLGVAGGLLLYEVFRSSARNRG
ncbi:23S rRNA (uridine(2479)-2'-O)-methyltransferase [Anaerolineae bacterium]|nr:23S rRNA (uridine(2479)-2'-O)-methyltransferase [Anaerolineae bacterium]